MGMARFWMIVSRMRFLLRNTSWSCSDRSLYKGPDAADPEEGSSAGESATIRAGRRHNNGAIAISRTIILLVCSAACCHCIPSELGTIRHGHEVSAELRGERKPILAVSLKKFDKSGARKQNRRASTKFCGDFL